MIIDSLDNAGKYVSLHPRFAEAFEFIRSQDLEKIEVGKYAIDGTDLHASVSLKTGYTRNEAKFEAHNHYIDIQVCPGEAEEMGWKPRSACVEEKEAYNPEKDVIFYKDNPDTYFSLKAG